MDDLISRQAAIDAIGNVPDYDDGMVFEALSHAQRDVALLPSAQPNLQPTCNQLATDTISRQAAIDAVRRCSVKEVTPAYMLIDKAEVMTELMLLPSAQPEIIRCRECIMHGVCRFEQGLGLDGYCSQAEKKGEEDG